MLVRDYFKQQKSAKLSTTEKFLLYQKILQKQEKRNKWLLFRRGVRKTVSVTATIIGAVFITLYATFLDTRTIRNGGYSILPFTQFSTQATTIGTIINAQGYFEIFTNGKKTITDQISDNDIIKIDKDSLLDIRISETIKAQVVGPATFSIHFIWTTSGTNNFRINLIEGSYVAIHGLATNKMKDTVEVAMPEGVLIKQEDESPTATKEEKKQTPDFIVTKRDKKPVVVNKGNTKLRVQQNDTKNEPGLFSEVWNNSIAMVNTENNTVSVEKMKEKEQATGTENEMAWRDIINPETLFGEVEWIINETLAFPLAREGVEIVQKTEDITISFQEWWSNEQTTGEKEDSFPLVNGKYVLSEEQLYKLEQWLYGTFVQNDLKNIFIYHILGKESEATIARANLSRRIARLYNAIGITTPYPNNDFASLKKSVDVLERILTKNYIVPDAIIKNMQATQEWISSIQKYEFWKAAWSQEEAPSFESIAQEIWFEETESMEFR